MSDFTRDLLRFITNDNGIGLFRAVVTVVLGALVGQLVSRGILRTFHRLLDEQLHMVVRRVVFFGIFGLSCFAALSSLGIDFSALLGAAGIFSVAIGFASQTSMSNLISGWFLIAERSFVVGDLIRLGGTKGEVLSIDALSVKLRTFDNLLVRIPNEQLIKSEVENWTRFPIRRFDASFVVHHKVELEDLRRVVDLVTENEVECLKHPEPVVEIERLNASGVEVVVKTWVRNEAFLGYKTRIWAAMRRGMNDAGIEIAAERQEIHLVKDSAEV
ncbi:MAG: mechanosensitive ion channel family protein [Deltaproteobacteria bacterium]|nr:mechanosensitive ion channel family protein [Deltaproteobacteria bacterium]